MEPESETDASKKQQLLDQLCSQYDAIWKHFEYIDSLVFKVIGIYFIFIGAVVAKIDLFLQSKMLSATFIVVVGIVFFVFLHRISGLLQALKMQITAIDNEKSKLHGFHVQQALPENYATGPRTSMIGKYAVFVFSALLAAHIALSSQNVAQQGTPGDAPKAAHP